MKVKLQVVLIAALATLSIAISAGAGVNPGDTITKDQADKVADLVSPGNLILVKQGMTMKIVPTDRLEWPPPYKAATEKYSPQVQLTPDGTLKNYQAGLPFPLVDANDPQAALKVMWNFSYRPLYTDDAISKNVEIASYKPGSTPSDPVEHFTIGNVGFYNNTGRTEVAPIPTDPEATTGGNPLPLRRVSVSRAVRDARLRIHPLPQHRSEGRRQQLDDESAHAACESRVGQRTFGRARHVRARRGAGRRRHLREQPRSRFVLRLRRENRGLQLQAARQEADARGRQCGELSGQGVPHRRRPNDLSRELGDAPALRDRGGRETDLGASAAACRFRSGSSISTPKDGSSRRRTNTTTTASCGRHLRPSTRTATARSPTRSVAIWPFKRMFQTALVDEDVPTGFSTVALSPGFETDEHESWYINMGIATDNFFNPTTMSNAAH